MPSVLQLFSRLAVAAAGFFSLSLSFFFFFFFFCYNIRPCYVRATIDVDIIIHTFPVSSDRPDDDDDELMLNVLRCHLTY